MLHLLPESAPAPAPQPYAEAVARLASVRHALRLVDPHGGGPAADMDDERISEAWEQSDAARRAWFDRRSGRLVSAAADGLESLLATSQSGGEPNAEASRALCEQIRRELADVARVILD